MSNSKYISLHNHSYYSYLDSLARPDEMAKKAKELGYSALALGDHGNVTGHIEFQKSCKKYGIKPILGIEAYWTNDHQAKERKSNHLTVLCQNNEGLSNLYKLTYISSKPVEQEGGFYYKPRISWADLEKYHKGLIVLSGCMASIINRAFSNNDYQLGKEYAERFIKILGKDRFFVEIQLVNDPLDKPDREIFIKEQDIIIESSRKLAKDLGLRCCATSDSHYVNKDDSFPHECLKAIEARATLNDPPANRDTGERGRLVFNGYDYYLRSEDEMKAKFTEEEINNTKLVAEMCNAEIPLKQNHMPKFDKDLSPSQSIELLKEKLREGWAKLGIAKKINKQEYLDRVKKEIADIEEAFLQDYFLIVWDVVKFCLNNKIPVGIGRGCLTGDCLVHTERGLINLSDVIIGDTVYDHLGLPQKVLKTYKYPVDEELLNIKTTNSFGSITLTKDHKVYAFRRKIGCDGVYQNINTKPEWIEAGLLKKGDALIIPNINNRRIINQNNVDLSSYADNDFIIENDKISKNIPIKNYIGIRALSKTLGISRNFLQKAKRGKLSDYTSDGRIATRTIKSLNSLCEHLNKNSIDYETWKKNKNTNINTFDRYLKWDEEFAYQIGKWVGDGWVATKTKYQVGIAFNSDDTFEIERTQKFFIDKGFKVSIRKEKDTKLTQLLINNKLLALWIKSFFCDYENTSKTKYLGDLVYLPNNLLRSLILGLQSADGHVEKYRECIDTTSPRLAKDIRTSLLYMGIKSSRITRKPFKRDKYLCKESYKIRFKGLSVPSKTKDEHKNIVRILDIKTSRSNFVYDITVNNSHSYLTSNFVVHNSASGSLCAYLLEITAVDPIEYGLIWERFYNIGRKGSYPDIDLDISIERRNEVVDYLRNKFGEDRIFQMCTVSTMASKAAIKDVGKVIGLPFSYMNELTDLFPHKCESIKQAIEEVPEIKALATEGEDKDTERWKQEISGSKDKAQIKVLEDMIAERQRQLKVTFDVAQRLENIARQRSSHASAILIADEPVFGKIPLCYDAKNGKTLTAFDMYDLEEMGYLKLDILGLKTLDVCSKIYNGNIRDFKDFSDKRVYELISNGYTRGIFQLETPLGKNWCKKIKPKNLNELSDINAIIRPAILEIGMADEYLKNRAKPEEIIYLHEDLKPILEKTFGVMTYQESMIQIVSKFAGFDLAKGDLIRKACIAKGSLMLTNHGPQKIEEVAKKIGKQSKYDQKILTIDKDNSLVYKRINNVWSNGEKEVFRLSTKNGFHIELTKDHEVFTQDGWKTVENLSTNDFVVLPNNYHYKGHGKFNKNKSTILSYFIGEGCYTDKCDPKITNSDNWILKNIKDKLIEEFGKESFKITIHPVTRCEDIHLRNNAKLWIQSIYKRCKSRNKYIPKYIVHAMNGITTQFIGSYFSGEGHVTKNSIAMSTTSKQIAKNLQILLLRDGIHASLLTKNSTYKNEPYISYNVCISERSAVTLFYNTYKNYICPIKLKLIESIITKEYKKSYKSFLIPNQIVKSMSETVNMHSLVGNIGGAHYSKNMTYDVANFINKKIGSNLLQSVIDSGFKFVGIKDIKMVGTKEVFDFEVEDSRCGFINGILVHNCGKKLPAEMAKYEKEFIDGCLSRGYKEETAKKLWKWVNATADYSFNKCISGETLVYRGNKERSKSIISIEHLFKIKNDKQYAIHGYGQILALDKDGRIRPRKIKDIYFNGKKETYTITLSNGKSIRTTKDHKFYTNNGYVKVEDFLINETSIICNNLNETEESIVISIEYHGLEDTYDIEMDTEEHNFVANGMVCSNSHSLAYAKLAYITAYLKLNDPSKFFWSLLYYSKNEQNPQEEIRSIFFDAKRFNVHILPPSIKRANKDFEVDGNNIYFGLSHVKGIGESAIKYIEKISGMSWHDILFSKIKKNIFDGMVLSGAMSHFGLSRKQMMMCKEFINQLTEKELPIFNHIFIGIPDKITKETKSEIKSLQLQKGKSFEESVQIMLDFINKENKELKIINANRASNLAIECQYFISNYDNGKEYCIRDLARFEGHYLGIPATCSSVDSFLNEKVSHFLIEVEKEKDNTQICAVAKISSFRQILDKRQREMAFITLEDKSFMLDAVMFNSCYSIHKTLIKQDSVLLFKGHKKGGSFIVNHVEQP